MKARIGTLVALGLLLGAGLAMAQLPGSPGGSGAFSPSPIFQIQDIIGGNSADQTNIQLNLPKPVVTGYVVLYTSESGLVTPPSNTRNWSDVLIFHINPGVAPPGSPSNNAVWVTYLSDSPSGPGYITNADLARTGIGGVDTTAVQSATNTQYVTEWSPAHTRYPASGNLYIVESSDHDVPGIGTAGLVLLAALLAMTGMVFVMRRRAAGGQIA